jgi:hypothetical protein
LPSIALPVDLPGERNLGVIRVVEVDVRPGESAQLGHASASKGGDGERGAVRLRGIRERLLDLLEREDRPARGLRDLGPFRGQHQRDRIHSAEAEPAGGELVDPAHCAEHGGDGRLALTSLPHVTDQGRQVVGRDAVEPAIPEAPAQMLIDRIAVAGLRGFTQIQHWPREPELGRLAEPQSGVRRHRLDLAPARQRLHWSRRGQQTHLFSVSVSEGDYALYVFGGSRCADCPGGAGATVDFDDWISESIAEVAPSWLGFDPQFDTRGLM